MRVAADGRVFGPDRERFWLKVDKSEIDGCWTWQGAMCGGRGVRLYGAFKTKAPRRSVLAHRYAWCLSHDLDIHQFSPDVVVRHKCDNGRCCNPAHLELGSQLDNIQDTILRGRVAKGEGVSSSKLTEEQVVQVLNQLKAGTTHAAIADSFGVSRAAISMISAGRNWAHVSRVATA